MLTYKDTTFCVNENCKKPCRRKLTAAIEQEADVFGLPLAVAEFDCVDEGE